MLKGFTLTILIFLPFSPVMASDYTDQVAAKISPMEKKQYAIQRESGACHKNSFCQEILTQLKHGDYTVIEPEVIKPDSEKMQELQSMANACPDLHLVEKNTLEYDLYHNDKTKVYIIRKIFGGKNPSTVFRRFTYPECSLLSRDKIGLNPKVDPEKSFREVIKTSNGYYMIAFDQLKEDTNYSVLAASYYGSDMTDAEIPIIFTEVP